MKYLFVFCLFFSAFSYSEAFYSKRSVVSSLSLGGTSFSGFRVEVEAMEDPGQGCNHNSWYMYEHIDGDANYNAVYSTLLSSKLSNNDVSFQIIGCITVGDRTYPKITHVYY